MGTQIMVGNFVGVIQSAYILLVRASGTFVPALPESPNHAASIITMDSQRERSINGSYEYGRVTGDSESAEDVPIPDRIEIRALDVETSDAFEAFELKYSAESSSDDFEVEIERLQELIKDHKALEKDLDRTFSVFGGIPRTVCDPVDIDNR